MVAGLVDKPYSLETRGGRWLHARFAEPWNIVSWAMVNGGWQRTEGVIWLYLQYGERVELAGAMHAEGWAGAVGFMTSRRFGNYVEASAEEGEVRAWAVGTVGLSNALRVGDTKGPLADGPGTINLLVCCSVGLTVEGALEALALVSEAKAVAVLEGGVFSRRSGLQATGTGTDYLAVAWPVGRTREEYAGKHTAVGAAMGRAALEAVREGVRVWTAE